MASFWVAQTPNEFREAAEQLKLVADARPTFALAKYYLARAMWRAGTPQRESYSSVTLKGQLKAIIDDQEEAVKILTEDALLPPANFLGNHGNDYVLLGLATGDPADINHGIDDIAKALKRDPTSPWLLANKGMALLAGGSWGARLVGGDWERKEEGLRSYDEASKGMGLRPAYAAGAISDLAVVKKYCTLLNSKDYCDALQPDLIRLKTKFMQKAWPAPSSPTTANLRMKIMPSPEGLGWLGPIDDINPGSLVMLVSFCDAPPPYSDACDSDADRGADYWGVWLVLPSLSGRVDPRSLLDAREKGKYEFRPYFMDGQPACLPAGKYRAEFYLNDQLVAQDENHMNDPPYEVALFRDLNVAICHPSEWSLWKSTRSSDPGLVGGYVDSNDNPQRGVFLFAYYQPRQASNGDAPDSGLRAAQGFLHSEGFIPTAQLPDSRFACSEHRERRIYRYEIGGVTLHSRVWRRPDGVVYVVLAFDRRPIRPAELTAGGDDDPTVCHMLSSAMNID